MAKKQSSRRAPASSKSARAKKPAAKPTKKPSGGNTGIPQPAKAIKQVKAAGEQTVINTMEVARRASRMKASADRKARLREYKAKMVAKRPRGLRLGPSGELRVLAEGDSWFDYPKILGTGGGLISHLEQIADIEILNMAHYGDEVRGMMALEQRERLEELLRDRSLGTFDLLMFSGGGNDVVGGQMCLWIRTREPGMSVADAIDQERYEDVLDLLEIGYRDLFSIRDELSPETHIVTHSYDIPQPNNKGVCGIGPWLKPSLDYRGWDDAAAQFEIVRQMLDRFDQILSGFQGSVDKFTHIHTQGMLDRKTDWHNELHPNRSGFRKVALAINNQLADVMPGHFRRR
ncbi:MAG: hypothetical protein IT435_19920 [Phycisphaerales bacterium]|nr:hypothetical protein [Phycisphaerales bacterium]